ncbi:MAG: hypothetical protein OSJ60_11970 [Lachnospiraceae bacterium]|jgi:hypothetical protein|nr:hypothetical protein [Lachnospiraceae bacterium]
MARCELERIKEMKEFLENSEEDLLMKRIDKMQSVFRNEEKLKKELLETIEELAEEKENGCVVISFLRSSYITGSHDFYIACYSDEPFVEEEPDSRYYSLGLLFEGIESDMDCMNKELEKKYIRILSSEKEEIRRWHIDNIYRRLGEILQLLFEDMLPQRGLDVFYGCYMDELELIGKI